MCLSEKFMNSIKQSIINKEIIMGISELVLLALPLFTGLVVVLESTKGK
jgi:hypothetical protein